MLFAPKKSPPAKILPSACTSIERTRPFAFGSKESAKPVVPFSLLADSPFAVIEDIDAARAFVAAASRRLDQPVNVVAAGAVTGLQAVLRGRRLPLPVIGPEWPFVRRASHLLGAPIPEHVLELMHRGRLADGSRMPALLGMRPMASTPEVIDRLHSWESVVRIPSRRTVA